MAQVPPARSPPQRVTVFIDRLALAHKATFRTPGIGESMDSEIYQFATAELPKSKSTQEDDAF